MEIANYGPITVHRQSHTPFTHHSRFGANFPSTAAEVSLENLLWDFPVPGILRDFGAGARGGGARDGHAVDSNDRNTRAIQVTARHRADHRSHRAAPERHRPDHRALSHPPPTLRGKVFWRGCCFPSSAKRFWSVSQRARPDVKRARPSDHGDARASRPSRECSVARAGERAARASRRPDRSPETRAPRCRHA